MLKHIKHGGSVAFEDEIQFETPFDYMFPDLARDPECLLIPDEATNLGLRLLGEAMGDPGSPMDPGTELDSNIPAVFTYLGQFIDHDITANTDRERGASDIASPDGSAKPLTPLDPAIVIEKVKNGRRPQLDLDSVYADGPALIASPNGVEIKTIASVLYEDDLKLRVVKQGETFIDLPRNPKTGQAIIADMRNDENVMISQLHAAVLSFHNIVVDAVGGASPAAAYARARQLTRWAYQYVVINDYLTNVCDPGIVSDVVANGPRFYAPAVSNRELFMPLEFSVAAFRFGHSMIRPSYRLNGGIAEPISIDELLEAVRRTEGSPRQLAPGFIVEWERFVGDDEDVLQHARVIDPKLAQGLFNLPFGDHVLKILAQRNLLRGFLLSLPTGQSIAHAMGIHPLTEEDLLCDEPETVRRAFDTGGFGRRTPLWYYVLKEAERHTGGQALGAVGSRIVAETLVGLVKQSPNSYLNSVDAAIEDDGIKVGGETVATTQDFLHFAGVL